MRSHSRKRFPTTMSVKNRVSPATTPEQRRHWEEQGYLLLERALSPAVTAQLLGRVNEVLEAYDRKRLFLQKSGAAHEQPQAFKIARAITETDALDILTDHPSTFPWLLTLLGPYLQILGTEIFVRRPGPCADPLIEWHTDGGPVMADFLPNSGNPVLQMKAQFFLTDLSASDSGNFMLVPGSHRTPFPEHEPPTAGAIQLIARAGDVLLFPWSLWHAVAPNRSGHERKSVTIRYGPMWSRTYDYNRLPPGVLARMTPRRRRLFGDIGKRPHPYDYFYPDPQEQLRLMLDEEAGPTR